MKKQGVVVFDFDGVIGDTAKEGFAQAVAAYNKLGGKAGLDKAAEARFRALRPFVTRTEHNYTVIRLIANNPKISFQKFSQSMFDAEVRKDTAIGEAFNREFFGARAEMRKKSPKEWLAMMGSFPRAAKLVRKLQAGNRVFIATTKDRDTVLRLLKRYNIGMPKENILTREFSTDKTKQLREIAKMAGVGIKQIVVVEDSLEQATAARKIGARAILAKYGYITPQQIKEAKRQKMPLIGGKKGPSPRFSRKIARIARRTKI